MTNKEADKEKRTEKGKKGEMYDEKRVTNVETKTTADGNKMTSEENKMTSEENKMTDAEKKEVLQDLDSDGTVVEVAEAMIAIDPSIATKRAADKLLKEADESSK
ncbi:MAG: hypothetical protein DKT66_16695 [Candidatus Melainabacteria bacterium]|nr:MAG: hypothetical protein DKT66_16695 [Candidatus Melainabacteria bacterium]